MYDLVVYFLTFLLLERIYLGEALLFYGCEYSALSQAGLFG
jgi:hypothetical protein